MLDMWAENQAIDDRNAVQHAGEMPAGFGDTFDAAWHEGQLFSSSAATENAHRAAVDSYVNEVKQLSGQDIRGDVYKFRPFQDPTAADLQAAAQGAVAKIKQERPDLQIPDLTDEELNRRAVAASAEAHKDYVEMSGREKTFGGKLGSFLGSTASATVDPINLIGLAVAPEAELGTVATAALWGGIGAGSQAINEVANAPFRNQVQPDYLASGQPAGNILEAGIGGAALGGLFKAIGATWTRMKTGEWPRSVRDAGNIVESEANIQQSNVLPGAEGEAAHREAMGKAIDDIVAGRDVDVSEQVRGLNPGDAVEPAMAQREAATGAAEAARAARVETGELPFEATAEEARAELHAGTVADSIAAFGVPKEEAAALAQRVIAAKSDDEARAILSEAMARPQTIADTVPSVSAVAKAERAAQAELPPALTQEDRTAALTDPNHEKALNTELERLRDTGQGGMIPVGVDEKGEPTYRLLDEAIQDAANDRDAAEQIEACINPPVEEENFEVPTSAPASVPSVSPAAPASSPEAPIEPPASPASPSVPAVSPAPLAAPVKETPPGAQASEPEILPPVKEDKALDAKIYQTMTGKLRPEFIDTPEFRALSEEHDALALRAVSSKFGRGGFSREDRLRLKDVEGQMNGMLDQEYGTLEKLADEHLRVGPSTIERHKTIEHDE